MLPSEKLAAAGMTWENLSEWSPEGMTGRMWDIVIPNMGLMALIRNLRNFDEKEISAASVRHIQTMLSDESIILKSRQLPFRFYQAYRSTESLRWSQYLETALAISLRNVPKLNGRTLVLVDRSGSMFHSTISDRSVVTFADVAALFGTVWKLRDTVDVDLYQFGSDFYELTGSNRLYGYQDNSGRAFKDYPGLGKGWTGVTKAIDMSNGAAILRGMDNFQDMGGTELYRAVEETYSENYHDRVIIITDEQTVGWGGIGYGRENYYDEMPKIAKGTSVYIWNLAGYQAGVMKSGRYHRHTFGGLSDTAFKQIPVLESGSNVGWPWETD